MQINQLKFYKKLVVDMKRRSLVNFQQEDNHFCWSNKKKMREE